jgi:uncharacterized protein (UPF0335 family)
MTKAGHNSPSGEQIRAYVERVEHLAEEKKALADDIKDVYAEAKGNGFDAKILRKIVQRRARGRDKVQEEDELLDLYEHAMSVLG